jgi:hypothetical protein
VVSQAFLTYLLEESHAMVEKCLPGISHFSTHPVAAPVALNPTNNGAAAMPETLTVKG